MSRSFLFDVWPYITAAILLMGLLVRCLFTRNIVVVNTHWCQTRSAFRGTVIWRSSLMVSLAIHLLILALPSAMLAWNSSPGRLYVAESLTLVAGLLALVSCAWLMWVQLKGSAAPAICEVCGTIFFVFLFLSLLAGCLVVVFHRWGSSWAALTLSPYVISLLRGRPASGLVAQMPFLVRLHVFCAFAAVAAFPFTRTAGTIVALLHYLFGFADVTFSGVVRITESWLHQCDLVPWLWPEED